MKLDRVKLAGVLYRAFRAQCFWHCPPDLVVSEENLHVVVQGLRNYGGRLGFLLSGLLDLSHFAK